MDGYSALYKSTGFSIAIALGAMIATKRTRIQVPSIFFLLEINSTFSKTSACILSIRQQAIRILLVNEQSGGMIRVKPDII